MIPTNDLRMFAKYKFLRTIRQSDGATLIATRKVPDGDLPIYWDVDENDPKPFKPLTLCAKCIRQPDQLTEGLVGPKGC
jgi:hypothetical protein